MPPRFFADENVMDLKGMTFRELAAHGERLEWVCRREHRRPTQEEAAMAQLLRAELLRRALSGPACWPVPMPIRKNRKHAIPLPSFSKNHPAKSVCLKYLT
jgi:hypothetical protein